MILPRNKESRHKRNAEIKCPKKYCENYMMANCTPKHCGDGRSLPNCWFSLGKDFDIFGQKFFFQKRPKRSLKGTTTFLYKTFIHHTNIEIFCIPCCVRASNDPRMPGDTNEVEKYLIDFFRMF